MAVNHWNTDNPHTHIVVRGRDDTGKDLIIAGDYIADGFRHRAAELATEWLGPRTELEIQQILQREVEQERWTSLDRTLQREAGEDAPRVRIVVAPIGLRQSEFMKVVGGCVVVDEGLRGGQREALSTASGPVRAAHRPQMHSLCGAARRRPLLPCVPRGRSARSQLARYGQAFKDTAVARLLPPHSATPDEVAREIGVSASTLERWRSEALAEPARERNWTAAARLDAVLTTAAMDEAAKSAWCREHGVYPQQLAHWRQTATDALASPEEARASPQATRADRRRGGDGGAAGAVKKARGDLARGRGRMIGLQDRQQLARDIQIAHDSGARLHLACQVAGIDVRTLQRYKAAGGLARGDARPQATRPMPAHALSQAERQRLLQVANEPCFADVPPARIVPMLADEGTYLASESSFARVLRAHGQNAHRGRVRSP